MLKTKILSIIIIEIIIIQIFTGCINNNNDRSNNDDESVERYKERMSYKYEVIAKINGTYNFILLIPIPENDNETVSNMIDYLELIEGKCNYKLNVSEYGNCLKIKSNNTFKLSINNNEILNNNGQGIHKVYLSMINEKIDREHPGIYDYSIWIYYNSTNVNNIKFSLNYYYNHSLSPLNGSTIITTIDCNLHNGWNLINATTISTIS